MYGGSLTLHPYTGALGSAAAASLRRVNHGRTIAEVCVGEIPRVGGQAGW